MLVPGDAIRLSSGDLVPAGARLVETNALHVQQAALTGESMPVEKGAPESVLDICAAYEAEGQSKSLDAGARVQSDATYKHLSTYFVRLQ